MRRVYKLQLLEA
uniref:Uncharacterized protein n=1 Tax=Anguilla anguilla TaxID=7936 RepID=A0A0E9QYT0_ANGAN